MNCRLSNRGRRLVAGACTGDQVRRSSSLRAGCGDRKTIRGGLFRYETWPRRSGLRRIRNHACTTSPPTSPMTPPANAAGMPSSNTANHAVGGWTNRPTTSPATAPKKPARVAPPTVQRRSSGNSTKPDAACCQGDDLLPRLCPSTVTGEPLSTIRPLQPLPHSSRCYPLGRRVVSHGRKV